MDQLLKELAGPGSSSGGAAAGGSNPFKAFARRAQLVITGLVHISVLLLPRQMEEPGRGAGSGGAGASGGGSARGGASGRAAGAGSGRATAMGDAAEDTAAELAAAGFPADGSNLEEWQRVSRGRATGGCFPPAVLGQGCLRSSACPAAPAGGHGCGRGLPPVVRFVHGVRRQAVPLPCLLCCRRSRTCWSAQPWGGWTGGTAACTESLRRGALAWSQRCGGVGAHMAAAAGQRAGWADRGAGRCKQLCAAFGAARPCAASRAAPAPLQHGQAWCRVGACCFSCAGRPAGIWLPHSHPHAPHPTHHHSHHFSPLSLAAALPCQLHRRLLCGARQAGCRDCQRL